MNAILYGVGVGPGDPKLITLAAVEAIRACPVIALPQSGDGEAVALQIARGAVPELGEKELLELPMPMTRDKALLEQSHNDAAQRIAQRLREGKSVAFLTLGDPSVYSTYCYVHKRVLAMGLEAQMIPGVPSFCAAAARLGEPLVEGAQALHVLPASYAGASDGLSLPGTKVLMKTGRCMPEVKRALAAHGLLESAKMVQKCGMQGETLYTDMRHVDEGASYFSIIIAKEGGTAE